MTAAVLDFRAVARTADRPTADERAHLDGELLEQSEARAAAEIHELFARGFAGESVCLPDAYLSRDGVWVHTEYSRFPNAAQEATDNEAAFRVLLLACKARKAGEDTGPLLDQFMSACADAYCADHAGDLAKAERDAALADARDWS